MACELLTREFENSKGEKKIFTVRQLPASASLDLHIELIGAVGTSVFPFIENKYNFGNIITFMRQNEHKVLTDLIKRVVCTANIEGQEIRPAMFDIHFNGELMLVCQVFAFVCEVNFKDFFEQGLKMNELRLSEEAAALAAEEQKSSTQAKT